MAVDFGDGRHLGSDTLHQFGDGIRMLRNHVVFADQKPFAAGDLNRSEVQAGHGRVDVPLNVRSAALLLIGLPGEISVEVTEAKR